jgi:glucose dehydrogenase
VRHDIWDYDAPSPVVLFDAEFDGEQRKAIAETSKTGWTYVLDRETGEPLLPIEDEAVPQDEAQKTAATQPIPQYPPFISHDVSDEHVADIAKLARANTKGELPPIVKVRIYTPFRKEIRVIVPGPQGGTNWQPMSYNPETGLLYICAMRSVSGYTRSGEKLPEAKQGQVADLGSVFTTTGFGTQEGYFGAWDPRTGKTVWQKRWPESCYSGTVSTAGGLVFVGRNGGEPAGVGEGTGHAGETPVAGDPENGEQVFADNCSGCHGLSGTGANGGPTLVGKTDRDAVRKQVENGGGGMPPFKGTLSDQEIQDVVSYVTERVAKSG